MRATDLNQAVREELDDVHYATMVAVGWHSRRGLLVMTNAGHPPPLWYRATRREWSRDRLMSIARGLDASSAEAFGTQLTSALRAFRGGGEPLDDQTIIVLRRSDI